MCTRLVLMYGIQDEMVAVEGELAFKTRSIACESQSFPTINELHI